MKSLNRVSHVLYIWQTLCDSKKQRDWICKSAESVRALIKAGPLSNGYIEQAQSVQL